MVETTPPGPGVDVAYTGLAEGMEHTIHVDARAILKDLDGRGEVLAPRPRRVGRLGTVLAPAREMIALLPR